MTVPGTRVEIERRAGLDREAFLEEYGRPGRPVILTDQAEGWPAYERWSEKFFRTRHGSAEVTLHRTGTRTTWDTTLEAFLRVVDAPGDGPPWYLAAWEYARAAPELSGDYTVPSLFRENWATGALRAFEQEWRWIYIGGPGTGSGMHVDVVDSSAWNVVVRGTKSWIFVPPEQTPLVDGGAVNAFAPDLDRHPRFEEATTYHAATVPGEVMFTPSGWWHQTRNEDLCIAVTENFLDETNHEAVMAAARERHPDEFEWFKLLVEATRAGYRRGSDGGRASSRSC